MSWRYISFLQRNEHPPEQRRTWAAGHWIASSVIKSCTAWMWENPGAYWLSSKWVCNSPSYYRGLCTHQDVRKHYALWSGLSIFFLTHFQQMCSSTSCIPWENPSPGEACRSTWGHLPGSRELEQNEFLHPFCSFFLFTVYRLNFVWYISDRCIKPNMGSITSPNHQDNVQASALIFSHVQAPKKCLL